MYVPYICHPPTIQSIKKDRENCCLRYQKIKWEQTEWLFVQFSSFDGRNFVFFLPILSNCLWNRACITHRLLFVASLNDSPSFFIAAYQCSRCIRKRCFVYAQHWIQSILHITIDMAFYFCSLQMSLFSLFADFVFCSGRINYKMPTNRINNIPYISNTL